MLDIKELLDIIRLQLNSHFGTFTKFKQEFDKFIFDYQQ